MSLEDIPETSQNACGDDLSAVSMGSSAISRGNVRG